MVSIYNNVDPLVMSKETAKAYEPSLYEDGIYKKWQDSGKFNPDNLALAPDAPAYSIVMPPPNVTGTLHMGHAVVLALQDILIRFHRMKGYRTLWLPGTDHAAIATQTRVEKDLQAEGLDRHQLGRQEFLARVVKFAKDSHDTIVNQIVKIGGSCDWSREAYTLDEVRTRAVRLVFKMMYDDDLIYRGERIVNWCPRCKSTLADDEVEYKKQKTTLYSFKYDKGFPVAISTTRPETKLGDTAVAVNPDDERYQDLIGREIETNFCGLPLKLKIIADRHVDMKFGTGALGVTPAHSFADWQLAHEHNLPKIKVIDKRGRIRKGFGSYYGKKIKEARELIIEELRTRDLIFKEEEIEHNLSVCYRCETPIEPLPSRQWFINVGKNIPRLGKSIKSLAIEAVEKGVFGRDKIRIIPERFEKNYFHWMKNLRDWCISRQIWFGHRIPVWYCENVRLAVPYSEKVVKSECHQPMVSVEDIEKCPHCGGNAIQEEDTLDTWFSSGLWTFSTLAKEPADIFVKDGKLAVESDDFKKFHPTAVLETGYDILFFWVARMIIMTTYAVGDIPFRDVYLHGLVRAEDGRKMSKSLGNVINPLEMIKKYGTDATRLSLVIGTTPGNDMNLSEAKVAGFRNFANKLWNVARFIKQNTGAESVAKEFKVEELRPADHWISEKMKKLIEETTADLENYRFSQAGERLRDFSWSDLADWYLETSKFEKNEVKNYLLTIILEDLLKLWHPFMPFVTETIWGEPGKTGPLMTEAWPDGQVYKKFLNPKGAQDFEMVKNIIVAIRNARSENRVAPAKKIKAVIYTKDFQELLFSQIALMIALRTGVEEFTIEAEGEKIENAIYLTVSGVEIYLIGALDQAKERARLEKEIAGLEAAIKNANERLDNPEFKEKAPAAVIKKEEKKLRSNQEELEKLNKQFSGL